MNAPSGGAYSLSSDVATKSSRPATSSTTGCLRSVTASEKHGSKSEAGSQSQITRDHPQHYPITGEQELQLVMEFLPDALDP
jgi:hypothetical protein